MSSSVRHDGQLIIFIPLNTNCNLLALLELRLQHLAVILHALDIGFEFGGLLYSRGIDVPISENVGRHAELVLMLSLSMGRVPNVCQNACERGLGVLYKSCFV